jgi:hypothetical protein
MRLALTQRPASVMRTFSPIPITRPVSSASASGIGSRRIAASIQPCQLSSRPLVRRCGNLSTHIAPKAILPEAVVNHRVVVFVRPYLGNLAYAALASGFLMTDIFSLRLLLISGYSGLVSYHILQRIPMRIPLRWSAFFVAVNSYMLVQLARDLYPGEFDPEDEALYIEARRPRSNPCLTAEASPPLRPAGPGPRPLAHLTAPRTGVRPAIPRPVQAPDRGG